MEVSGPSTTQRFGKPPDCTGSTLGACPSGTTRHGGRTHGGSATAPLPVKSPAMRVHCAWHGQACGPGSQAMVDDEPSGAQSHGALGRGSGLGSTSITAVLSLIERA